MKIEGRATHRVKMLDKYRYVLDWSLATEPSIMLAEAIVENARKYGGIGHRKLPWLWQKAPEAGWDRDEVAYWIISGDWHELRIGQDLRETF